MKFNIKINSIHNLDEIKEYWTNDDYLALLEAFNFPDAGDTNPENLRELLFMAISDFEPAEAAKIMLEYKFSEKLSAGQIDQISSDMLIDTVCEEYPEMELQAPLFHINQLLFKAYNGTFPSAKATIIDCSITALEKDSNIKMTREVILKLLSYGLSDRNIIKRLFSEQLEPQAVFPEAENIIWELHSTDHVNFKVITAENLLKVEDMVKSEFEGTVEIIENPAT